LIQYKNRLKVITKDAGKLAMKEAFAWNRARLRAYAGRISSLRWNARKKAR
jgi:hypothetical protein